VSVCVCVSVCIQIIVLIFHLTKKHKNVWTLYGTEATFAVDSYS